jgi:hypothetical protein
LKSGTQNVWRTDVSLHTKVPRSGHCSQITLFFTTPSFSWVLRLFHHMAAPKGTSPEIRMSVDVPEISEVMDIPTGMAPVKLPKVCMMKQERFCPRPLLIWGSAIDVACVLLLSRDFSHVAMECLHYDV